MNTTAEKRKQVIENYEACNKLALFIAQMSADIQPSLKRGACDEILEGMGQTTTAWLEVLLDIIASVDMDVDLEAGAHIDDVLEAAQVMFPESETTT